MLRYKDKQKERFKRLMKKIYCENPRGREGEYIDILSKYNIPWMEYREETFKEDQEILEKIRDITNNS